jgi:cellulose synthase (UDP-forming)
VNLVSAASRASPPTVIYLMSTRSPSPADTTFDADTTLDYLESPRKRVFARAVSILALVIYAAYLVYRARYTINEDALAFSLLVYAAEVHGFFALAFYFHQLWTLRTRRPVDPAPGRSVDVFITTLNEDLDLLRQTLRGAVSMRYPHETYVLDDGRRPEVRALAEELGCHYLTRETNTDAKAGNWNNAFRQTSGELIATFDADHVPRAEFLERTLGYFEDPKVAFVQAPQIYYNLDSVQHRVSWRRRRMFSEQDAFFNLVMPGKDHWNAAFFCGTGAVLRRRALEPHGGVLTGTITEDLHTSVVLHREGWKSVYLNDLLVTGLAPVDLRSFGVQRLRWAEGNLTVAGRVNPLTTRGLTLHQRLSYLASLFHWTIGIPKLIYYVAPPWMLFSGAFPIANFDRPFVLFYLTNLLSLILSYEVVSRGKGRLIMDELFSMVSFFTLIRALKRVFLGRGRARGFEVTDKHGSASRAGGPILPHLALLAFSAMAIVWSVLGVGFAVSTDRFGAGMAIFWTIYNAGLMWAVIKLGNRPPNQRHTSRFRANIAVEDAEGTLGVTADISPGGCALLWPTPLPVGSMHTFRVHFGPTTAEWQGLISSEHGRQVDGWYRYGLTFMGLSTADIDLINDSVFALVVPDLFRTLNQPSWLTRTVRAIGLWASASSRARAPRQAVRVPVRVTHPHGSFVTTARQLSTTGVSLSSPVPVAPGSTVTISMRVPTRTWQGTLDVARCEARPSRAGFDTWLLGLRFEAAQPAAEINFFRQWDAA